VAGAGINDTFSHRQHLQCLPAKETDFALQQAGLDGKLASGACLRHWKRANCDKFRSELSISAGVCKDSQLPMLKLPTQAVFRTARLPERCGAESCLTCAS